MQYTFKKTDSGYIGKAFEMSVKDAVKRRFSNEVSPAGRCDFRFRGRCYDVKQNGTVLQYNPRWKMIQGSTKVIYASHVDYIVVSEDEEYITIAINLADTQMFCVDRDAFVSFLLEEGLAKSNSSRDTINIQTGYNYKKNSYHGRTGKRIEAWCYENETDDDDIIGAILSGK